MPGREIPPIRRYALQTCVLLLLALALGASWWSARRPASLDPSQPAGTYLVAQTVDAGEQGPLVEAAHAIGCGHFDVAREELDAAPTATAEDPQDQGDSWAATALQSVLTEYETLRDESHSAQAQAYEHALKDLDDALQQAHWRDALLERSQSFDFTNDAKTEEETRLTDEARKKWLLALGQLRFAHELATRMDLEDQVDPDTRQAVVDRCRQIADALAQDGKYMEAYIQVYYHLERLFPEDQAYEEAGERFVRQAALAEMYAPDPNQETLPWRERRDGVSFSVFSEALERVAERYVEFPPFRKMARTGLRNCILLAETPRVAQTFTALDDSDLRDEYLAQLRPMYDELATAPAESIDYSYILGLLRSVQQLNARTLDLPGEVLIAEYAEGVFAALDGYTYVVWPGEVRTFRKDMTGEFSGIGVEIGRENGLIRINSLLEGGSAASAGLDAGDLIVSVEGKPTSNMSLNMAVERITGKEGTTVNLTIDRDGWEQPRDFELTRRKIVVHTVKGLCRDNTGQWQWFLDPQRRIGYVRLTNFYGETTESLKHALHEMRDQGLGALVLDLRDNSGGFLGTAVEVADLFLRSGVIVSTAARGGEQVSYDWAHNEGTFDASMPLVVLTNHNSASASEIVAGALQDQKRAIVVGTRSFGKGNVQVIQPLRPSDAELKMTVAYYYLPSGRRVHRDPDAPETADYGVHPDARLELTTDQLQTLLETRREATVLHQENGDQTDWTLYAPDEVRQADPQLQLAWLCLRGELVARKLSDAKPARQFVGPVVDAAPRNPAPDTP